MWDLTQNPLYLGYFGLVNGVPLVLFQLFGGVLADRADRKRLLVGTQLATWGMLTTATVLTLTGLIRVEVLLTLSFLSAVFRAFEQPARMALIPHIVSPKNLPNAIAIGSMPWQTGRIVGPAIGGVLIWQLSAGAALGFGAAAYLVAIVLYAGLAIRGPVPVRPTGSMARQLGEGIGFISRSALFATLIGLTFFNSLFGMAYIWVLPAFVSDVLDGAAGGFGALQAGSGAGAILGTIALASVATRLSRRGLVMLCGAMLFGALLILLSRVTVFWMALAIIPLMGFANTFYVTTVSTVLQERVPDALRGRVMGIFGLCWNLVPLGGILLAAIASATDLPTALLTSGALVFGSAVARVPPRPARPPHRLSPPPAHCSISPKKVVEGAWM
ncbi:MAG: MFS transporter [Dehalococcoidia bacterium]|nr:MAG: MFS transporter [Dehalococcoidia bacterium]